jgi:hypothetical protein
LPAGQFSAPAGQVSAPVCQVHIYVKFNNAPQLKHHVHTRHPWHIIAIQKSLCLAKNRSKIPPAGRGSKLVNPRRMPKLLLLSYCRHVYYEGLFLSASTECTQDLRITLLLLLLLLLLFADPSSPFGYFIVLIVY